MPRNTANSAKKYHLYNKIKKAESTGPTTPKRKSRAPSAVSKSSKPVSFNVKSPELARKKPSHKEVSGPGAPSFTFSKGAALSRTPLKPDTPQKPETPQEVKPSPSIPLGPTPSMHGKVISLLDGLDGTPVKERSHSFATPVKTVSIALETPTHQSTLEINDEFTTPAYLNRIAVEVSPMQKRLSFAERIRQSVIESPIEDTPSPEKPHLEEIDEDEAAWREMEGLPPIVPKPAVVEQQVEDEFEDPDLDDIMGAVEVSNPYDEPVEDDLAWVHETVLEGETSLSAPVYREGMVKKRKHQTQKRTSKKAIVRVESELHKKAKVDNNNFSTSNKLNTGFKVNMGQKQWASRFKK